MADDINISPEMINNLVNMLKNNTSTNNNENNENGNSINLGEILGNFSSNQNSDSSQNSNSENSNSSNPFGSLDFETILKIKSIMETLNDKNDPKSNLLYSLKPYLRQSKQAKFDQYVNLLKISQVSKLFKNDKGEIK